MKKLDYIRKLNKNYDWKVMKDVNKKNFKNPTMDLIWSIARVSVFDSTMNKQYWKLFEIMF